jgi:exopolysaccharide production protein ExoQ
MALAKRIAPTSRGEPLGMTNVTGTQVGADVPAQPALSLGSQVVLGRIACGFFFLLPVCAVTVPRAVVILLVGTAVLASIAAGREAWSAVWLSRRTSLDRGLAWALAGLILWCAAASLWSFDPPRALLLVLRVSSLFAAALVLHLILRAAGAETHRRLGRCLVAGIGLALGIATLEILFGFPIGHLKTGNPDYTSADTLWLNRGATALSILVWPAAGYLWRRGAKGAALVLPAVTLTVLAFLSSLAAIVGLLLAALTVLATLLRPRFGRPLLIAATLAVTIGSPIAAHQLYAWDWQRAEWLPFSAQHRVEIWRETIDYAGQKPLIGHGFDTSRDLGRLVKKMEPSGRVTLSTHPHNAPLQILVELGLVGILITLGVAWALIRGIDRLPAQDRPFARGAYVASLVVACTAFGLWQNQWIALLACTAIAIGALGGARSDLSENRDQADGRL